MTTRKLRFTADETLCNALAALLSELLDADRVAVAVYEQPAGWAVEAYFQDVPDEAALRGLVREAVGDAQAAALSFGDIAERDWVAASLRDLKPVAAGRFVVHGRHDRARVPLNRIGIEIEAALAFGTGHHGTTRGCLLALDRVAKSARPRRILDVGTGTGVLAIAAAKLLRSGVLASDVDAVAVRVARANARANGAGAAIEFVQAAGVSGRRFRQRAPYDLILANILLGPLKALAAPLSRLVAANGRLVLSGLLPAQAKAIVSAYGGQGLRLQRRLDLDGWTTLVLARAPRAPAASAGSAQRTNGSWSSTRRSSR